MARHPRDDRVAATVEAADRFPSGRVRQLRLEAGLSQAALAARCGVAYQQLAKYESGENGVSAARLFLLAEALGASPATLFDGLDELLARPARATRRRWRGDCGRATSGCRSRTRFGGLPTSALGICWSRCRGNWRQSVEENQGLCPWTPLRVVTLRTHLLKSSDPRGDGPLAGPGQSPGLLPSNLELG